MSKKSERIAQVRKYRIAERQKSDRPAEPEAQAAAAVPAPRWKLVNPFKLLPRKWVLPSAIVAGLAAFVGLSGLMSLVLPPSVPVPNSLVPSIVPPVEIVNPSLLPIYKVNYACEFVAVEDQAGLSLGPSVRVRNPIQTKSYLLFHQKVPVECVGGTSIGGVRIQHISFKVSISYFHLGWPFRRYTEYLVRSDFDPQGRFMRWEVE
ncbi:MAG TPA: hypothetical protein VMH81_17395 [Bryobacteraceae bacterium]|nr:hypothetical protein [Bryobacteraceae bacterium]